MFKEEKMRKSFFILCCCMFSWLPFQVRAMEQADVMEITRQAGYDLSERYRPKSSIVIDADTGEILYQDHIDLGHDPASMSKLMTIYLVLEAIKQGKLSYDTPILATDKDQAIANIQELSNNHIIAGVHYKVSDLFTMALVPSSNVATLMLANYLSQNDADAWLDQMNAKAKELGMTNTQWNNASGAVAVAFKGYYQPNRYDNAAYNETTARDMAILGYHLVNEFPELMEYTKNPVVTVLQGTPYQETFEGYNHSLPGDKYGLEGEDGLKTGSSPHAAYNYIATVKRGNHRLVEVILGVSDWDDDAGEFLRHPIGNALIEYAYSNFEYGLILPAGEHEINGKHYRLQKDFYGTYPKGQAATVIVKQNHLKVQNGLEIVSSSLVHGQEIEEIPETIKEAVHQVVVKPTQLRSWTDLFLDTKLLFTIPFLILLIIIGVEYRRRKIRSHLHHPQNPPKS